LCPIECREALKQIELFLDGELGPSMHAEIHEHLGSCDSCTGHWHFRRRLKELLRATCGCDEVPTELLQRVHEVLHRPPVV
jgi:mycothiol system anti-sigma-R factor